MRSLKLSVILLCVVLWSSFAKNDTKNNVTIKDKKLVMKLETITVGGGCFWCTESVFRAVKGIISVESGYAGGKTQNPTYKDICTGMSGHAEVVQIQFNKEIITLEEVLLIFMGTHDPTALNRQGNDIGTQYRSVIFYEKEEQKLTAKKLIKELREHYKSKIVTEISLLDDNYYKAEEYHQNYYFKNPDQAYCNAVIPPKLSKLRKLFADKMLK